MEIYYVDQKGRVKRDPSKLLKFDKDNWYIVISFLAVGGLLAYEGIKLIFGVY